MALGKPLAGLRVVDLTNYLPGPLATLLLSDLGAEVIKVEAPPHGDPLRSMPPVLGGTSVLFHCLNRGKRFVTLDLREDADRDRLLGLLDGADCLVDGFRPDVLPRLGLDPVDLSRRFPRLITARLSGYGQDGPFAGAPGHDINYLALTGVLDQSPSEFPLPIQVADVGAALLSLSSVLAVLLGTARGQAVERILDLPILDAALVFAMPPQARQSGGDDPTIGHGFLEGGLPIYRMYRDGDGRLVSVAGLEPKFAMALDGIFGATDESSLEKAIGTRSTGEISDLGDQAPCVEPVLTLEEARAHPAVRARSSFRNMRLEDMELELPVTPFASEDTIPSGPWAGLPGSDNDSVLI